jgi:hypothetical protein
MRAIERHLPTLKYEGDGRARPFLDSGAASDEQRLDLLPVKAAI